MMRLMISVPAMPSSFCSGRAASSRSQVAKRTARITRVVAAWLPKAWRLLSVSSTAARMAPGEAMEGMARG